MDVDILNMFSHHRDDMLTGCITNLLVQNIVLKYVLFLFGGWCSDYGNPIYSKPKQVKLVLMQ